VIVAVAVAAAIGAAFLVWKDRPQPRPVSSVSAQGTAAETDGSVPVATGPVASATHGGAPASTGAPNPQDGGRPSTSAVADRAASPPGSPPDDASVIVVSVTGLVKHPGLVRLAPGSRVADAIHAAGGVTGNGDLTGMNLAARLTDGSSVVVGTGGAGSVVGGTGPPASASGGSRTVGAQDGSSPSGSGGPAPIDLNTADATALDSLPGVGPVMAAAIVAYRQQHGAFTSVDQLQAIPGIGPARFAQIAPHVTVGGSP
jgi:competence protein ComEA